MILPQKKESLAAFFLLVFSVSIFFGFGFFHLAKFETADEHLWKYGRIKQYWQAIANKKWKETYINDKPGVTIAIFSGSALLLEPNPENHKISDSILTQNGLFNVYDIEKTEYINLIFRLPVLIVSSLSLFLFFWLALKAFRSKKLALLTTAFIATSPVLVGMSQIVNPDSFFWIFGGLSAFSFLALLNTQEKKFIFITGVLTGFALLSKYTAAALFLFYFLAIFSKIIFERLEEKNNYPNFNFASRMIFYEFLIFVLSIAIFCFFLPAVFVKPDYLLKGISQFFEAKMILAAFAAAALFLGAAFYLKKNVEWIFEKLNKNKKMIASGASFLFLLIVFLILLNVWTEQAAIPFDKLRDAAYANEPKKFNFGNLLKKDSEAIKNIKLFLMEPYPLIFSLTPLAFFLIIFIAFKSFLRKIRDSFSSVLFPSLLFFIAYFILTVYSGVVANVRYSIIFYPFFALLCGMAVLELPKTFKISQKKSIFSGTILILVVGTLTLWIVKPFYFGYTSFLLPKKFTITQSWGHGTYEAAQYLNSLPDAKNKIIWSNTNTICMFFKGKCLSGRKIDLGVVKPDYFVLSKRGELKANKGFIFTNPDYTGKNSSYYYENLKTNYEWAIFMNDREEDYIKVVKFEK